MDVKESTQTAKRYIAEVFSDENIRDIRLEEVELDDASGVWRITVSFLRPAQAPEQPGRSAIEGLALGIGVRSRPLRRAYKVVEIDDGSGRVRAVKHRVLEDVD